MVDVERIGSRLDRLERLIELLDEDLGAQLVSELSVEPPADYAGLFHSLARGGYIEADLRDALAAAAGQRNVLVHMYLDIDDHEVFSALGRLDDPRRFAA
ncbi:MAG: HepT-like ribonuclease domain-containing protein [Thermoleophilaceae bacterium]